METHALNIADLETKVNKDLLIARVQGHVTRDRVSPHSDRLRLKHDRALGRRTVVAKEDLAHELRTQLQEGADLVTLASNM